MLYFWTPNLSIGYNCLSLEFLRFKSYEKKYVCVCVRACVRACVRVCVCVRACVCVCAEFGVLRGFHVKHHRRQQTMGMSVFVHIDYSHWKNRGNKTIASPVVQTFNWLRIQRIEHFTGITPPFGHSVPRECTLHNLNLDYLSKNCCVAWILLSQSSRLYILKASFKFDRFVYAPPPTHTHTHRIRRITYDNMTYYYMTHHPTSYNTPRTTLHHTAKVHGQEY